MPLNLVSFGPLLSTGSTAVEKLIWQMEETQSSSFDHSPGSLPLTHPTMSSKRFVCCFPFRKTFTAPLVSDVSRASAFFYSLTEIYYVLASVLTHRCFTLLLGVQYSYRITVVVQYRISTNLTMAQSEGIWACWEQYACSSLFESQRSFQIPVCIDIFIFPSFLTYMSTK